MSQVVKGKHDRGRGPFHPKIRNASTVAAGDSRTPQPIGHAGNRACPLDVPCPSRGRYSLWTSHMWARRPILSIDFPHVGQTADPISESRRQNAV
jgi:hypothetical protein